MKLPDPPLRHPVPKRHEPVAAAGRERAVGGVEGERVDGVHDVDAGRVGRGLPVALERVLARLRVGRGVEPLDRHAALDAARRVAQVVGHAGHRARHELEAALAPLPGLRRERGVRGPAVDRRGRRRRRRRRGGLLREGG